MFYSPGRPEEMPDRKTVERAMRRRHPRDNELPVTVTLDLLLARTDEVAVLLSAAHVYRQCVSLELQVRTRRVTGRHGLGANLHGHGPAGPTILLGVEFADGRRASTAEGGPGRRPWDVADDEVLLSPGGGSSGLRTADLRVVLSPIPPPGPLTFVLAWAVQGIADSRVVSAADPLREAATRVQELWPWEPEPQPPYEEQPPDLPPGWFSETAERSPRPPRPE